MKTTDIDMLTGEGHYVVDVPIGYIKDKIDDWSSSSEGKGRGLNLQLNPDFQRGHVWTKEQQIAFMEFILRGGKTSSIQFNHPNWMGSFKGEFVCVDGLQRLTAISKFVSNELPVFNGTYLNDFDDPKLLLRKYSISIRINNLKTRKEVLKWYLELNSGGTPHSENEIKKVEEMLKQQSEQE